MELFNVLLLHFFLLENSIILDRVEDGLLHLLCLFHEIVNLQVRGADPFWSDLIGSS